MSETYVYSRALKVMMEFHGLQAAVEQWSDEYPGLEIDDLLDQGVEADRSGEIIWFNYDAFWDQEELLNVVLECDIDTDYYSVIMTERSGDEIDRITFKWDDTIEVVLKKLNTR